MRYCIFKSKGIVDRLSSSGQNRTRIGCRKCGFGKYNIIRFIFLVDSKEKLFLFDEIVQLSTTRVGKSF